MAEDHVINGHNQCKLDQFRDNREFLESRVATRAPVLQTGVRRR